MSNKTANGQVLLPNVRLGYPTLWEAKAIKGDPNAKPRFGAQLYLSKDDKKTKVKIDAEIKRLCDEHFDGQVKSKNISFLKDGDGDDGDANTEGCWIISANRAASQGRPQVVDRNPNVALIPEDGRPYAGCHCNVLVAVYKPKGWDKICASLEIVQFAADGEPFGAGRVDAAAVMPGLDEDDDFEA